MTAAPQPMLTVARPTSAAEAARELSGGGARPRAGGTDLAACLEVGALAPGPLVDLLHVPELRGVRWAGDGAARIGAMTTVAELASDPGLVGAYPGLSVAARALATPQIRGTATVGGNLLQRNRCSYLRNPAFDCFQTGGDSCPSRTGDHLRGVVVDQGPCVAPHPSSLAVALLAYDATVRVRHGSGRDSDTETERGVAELYEGADPTRDHVLGTRDLLVSVGLPAPVAGERAAHLRAAGRSRAEWPLVEAVARLECADGGTGPVARAWVAVGGVARTPLRLTGVERALVGSVPGRDPGTAVAKALDALAEICSPLPATGYKVPLLRATVRGVIERSLDAPNR
ncbi:xanthine dehydrogenase family protein subunit M [Nocardiopsis metallicus]|uniref:Xanthine dehydrogenase YagS FAD-binding subunit n=2 Tax=Nocardiopsis metallicus TaxID=179819 RepID=A0A840WAS9_9ACTN|nr:xanthine dehydrogenase YagS FAD-binding subunit [Nocardiopsis metallicus]